MGRYSDRVAPLVIGAKVKQRDNPYYTNTWTITSIKHKRYTLSYDGPQKAFTNRNKEDLREEFEYIFPWESLVKSITEVKRNCYCTSCNNKRED